MNMTSSPTPESSAGTQPQAPDTSKQSPASEPARPSAPAHPWDLQPGETPYAFRAFQRFLELGPDANITNLAKPDRSDYDALKQLSYRFHWRERAAAHQQHQAQHQAELLDKAMAECTALLTHRAQILREQEWGATQGLIELADHARDKALKGEEIPARLDHIAHLYATVDKLGHNAVKPPATTPGMSAEVQAAIHESEIALHKIYGAMLAEGLVPNVHDQINAERTAAQPANPADPPKPPAPDTQKPQ